MNEIIIVVNGNEMRIPPGSVSALIERMGLDPTSLATAVNGEFVARDARQGRALADGDAVTVFRAIVGG